MLKASVVGLVALLLLSQGAVAAPSSRSHVKAWLLDDLPNLVFTPALPSKGPPSSQNLQDMWQTDGQAGEHPWRRRVVLKERANALQDMRDALLLPAGTRMAFSTPTCAGGRLVASMAPLKRGKGEVLSVTISAGGKELWKSGELTARSIGDLKTWPEEVRVPLPGGPAELALSGDGGMLALANPRLECDGPGPGPGYNVIYIVVDALRSDVVGVHRKDFPSVSPEIDRLEASGTTFPRGYANGNTTLLSMNAMLFGAHPRALGFLVTFWAGKDYRSDFYRRPPPYLTRLLRKAGYLTYAAVHNHLYFPGYQWGVDPGFEIMQDCRLEGGDATVLTDLAVRFMEKHGDKPFLLELNLLAPHQPYKPPREYLDKVNGILAGLKEQPMVVPEYLGEVAWADHHVGILMKELERLGLRDKTLVILTADHGEVMDPLHAGVSGSGKKAFQSHGVTVYDEEINVPMIFSMPGLVKTGVRQELVQHVDIAPTVLELLGLAIPSSMTGRSILSALKGGPTLAEVPVFSERWVSRVWVKEQYKLIFHSRKDDFCPRGLKDRCKAGEWMELYDLKADPHERKDLSKELPEVVKTMSKELEDYRRYLYEHSGGKGPDPR